MKASAIKSALLALVPFLVHLKFSFVNGVPGIQFPDLNAVFPDLPHLAATMLVYYELLVRFVPSLENNSVVHLVYQLLNAVIPNHAVTDNGGLGYHTTDETVTPKPGAGGTGLAVA
ncbi:MAG: hypothetical protein EOO37_00035 [Cytophagaceae bacterium]|nr:MAG: hypothetical protein EOO37_00035 [Cytophagaceae bacterium]